MTRFTRLAIVATASALALAACSRPADAPAAKADVAMTNDMMAGNEMTGEAIGAMQSVAFTGADGKPLGSVSLSDGANGATMSIKASGMPAGVHGIHLHEKGLCDGPKFETAGKHWNPTTRQHGRANPKGAHMGDLANLTVAADGTATTTITLAGVMLASGTNMLADADGTSLVIHAKPDDYKTDPSGDSGDRVACAVVAAAK